MIHKFFLEKQVTGYSSISANIDPSSIFQVFFDRRVNELLVTNPILLHIIDLFDKNRPEAIQKLDITTYRSKTAAILVECHFGTMGCLVPKIFFRDNSYFRLQKKHTN